MTTKDWIENPKTKGSGMICCIPQKGPCPLKCADCFYNAGRSYLEPLEENTPHIPTPEMAKGRVVRMNDGWDSNLERELVEATAQQYYDYFFNTSIPKDLGSFSGPVVLTVNPGKLTDKGFHKLVDIPPNLMFVRVRTNLWNWNTVVVPAVEFYTGLHVPVVLTWMAYYETPIPEEYLYAYVYCRRTINTYWCIETNIQEMTSREFKDNPYVHQCAYKNSHSCVRCGNCLREYFATKERMRGSV